MSVGDGVAVIGGGWAGLAAAVESARIGAAVTLFEMAPQLGGRARGVTAAGGSFDNGQHILIGAYRESLALLRAVGVDLDHALLRTPLCIAYPDGSGLALRPGTPVAAFVRAVVAQRGWSLSDRLALLRAASGWALRGFRCDAASSVADLTARLPRSIRDDLIDPLCVAALNTPADAASATVFLRVLRDALFSGPGSSDLLLPRVDLSSLLAEPARQRLERAGARLRLGHRVASIEAQGAGWSVDGERFGRVVVATTAIEAARLTRRIDPDWSDRAGALAYEPIVTVYLHCSGARLPAPMLALRSGPRAPAQFVFDRGQLGGPDGQLAFVVSGARDWVERGRDATGAAVLEQAHAVLGRSLPGPLRHVETLTEKRATFRCTPQLDRPRGRIAPGLHAAGDYIDGPYPATLEGAVRSARQAVRSADRSTVSDARTAPRAARR